VQIEDDDEDSQVKITAKKEFSEFKMSSLLKAKFFQDSQEEKKIFT
jgi:hypothetical protein